VRWQALLASEPRAISPLLNNRSIKMKLKILTLAATLGIIAPALAQTNPPTVPGARIAFAASDFDFGKVDAGTLVKHEFIFTNTGDQTLEVTTVRPSCGCTTAGQWDKKVEPGQTGKIPVQFNSTAYGGEVHKTIFVECNDATKSNLTLNLNGTVWKMFNVTPAYAMFSLRPEQQGIVTQAVKIINNSDQPAAISDPACGNPTFKMEIKTVQEGKEYELRVTTDASSVSGTMSAPITLKTSSPKMPQLTVLAYAMMPPLLAVNPPQIMLPAGPLPKAAQFTVTIQNNSTNPVTLSEPKINAEGVEVQMTEQQPGRQFSLTVNFPAGFQSQSSLQATVKSSNSKYPMVTIPVYQPQPPASAPAATPAMSPPVHSGSAAVQPVSAAPAPIASRK
jgi:hypothetical protein